MINHYRHTLTFSNGLHQRFGKQFVIGLCKDVTFLDEGQSASVLIFETSRALMKNTRKWIIDLPGLERYIVNERIRKDTRKNADLQQ